MLYIQPEASFAAVLAPRVPTAWVGSGGGSAVGRPTSPGAGPRAGRRGAKAGRVPRGASDGAHGAVSGDEADSEQSDAATLAAMEGWGSDDWPAIPVGSTAPRVFSPPPQRATATAPATAIASAPSGEVDVQAPPPPRRRMRRRTRPPPPASDAPQSAAATAARSSAKRGPQPGEEEDPAVDVALPSDLRVADPSPREVWQLAPAGRLAPLPAAPAHASQVAAHASQVAAPALPRKQAARGAVPFSSLSGRGNDWSGSTGAAAVAAREQPQIVLPAQLPVSSSLLRPPGIGAVGPAWSKTTGRAGSLDSPSSQQGRAFPPLPSQQLQRQPQPPQRLAPLPRRAAAAAASAGGAESAGWGGEEPPDIPEDDYTTGADDSILFQRFNQRPVPAAASRPRPASAGSTASLPSRGPPLGPRQHVPLALQRDSDADVSVYSGTSGDRIGFPARPSATAAQHRPASQSPPQTRAPGSGHPVPASLPDRYAGYSNVGLGPSRQGVSPQLRVPAYFAAQADSHAPDIPLDDLAESGPAAGAQWWHGAAQVGGSVGGYEGGYDSSCDPAGVSRLPLPASAAQDWYSSAWAIDPASATPHSGEGAAAAAGPWGGAQLSGHREQPSPFTRAVRKQLLKKPAKSALRSTLPLSGPRAGTFQTPPRERGGSMSPSSRGSGAQTGLPQPSPDGAGDPFEVGFGLGRRSRPAPRAAGPAGPALWRTAPSFTPSPRSPPGSVSKPRVAAPPGTAEARAAGSAAWKPGAVARRVTFGEDEVATFSS